MAIQLPEIDDADWIAVRWAEIEAQVGNLEDVSLALWPEVTP